MIHVLAVAHLGLRAMFLIPTGSALANASELMCEIKVSGVEEEGNSYSRRNVNLTRIAERLACINSALA